MVDELLGWMSRRYPQLARRRHLGIGGRGLLADVRRAGTLPGRIHLAIGTAESRDPAQSARVLADAVELGVILRAKGLGPRRLHLHIEAGGRHREGDWAGRLPDALRFLFG